MNADLENLKKNISHEISYKIFLGYLHSLNNEEIVKIYWNYLHDKIIYKYIRTNIINRINNDKKDKHLRKLITEVLRKFPKSNYETAVKLRSLIAGIADVLTKRQKRKVFDLMIEQKRRNDRKLASKLSKDIFNEDIKSKLLKVWSSHQDESILIALINNKAINLEENYEEILKIIALDDISSWIKRRLYLKIAERDFAQIAFLKEYDPISYIYLAAKFGKEVENQFILDVIEHIDEPDIFGLLTWSAGKLGKKELLMKLNSNAEQIHKEIMDKYFQNI